MTVNSLHSKFLIQLKTDIAKVASGGADVDEKFARLAHSLEIDDSNSDYPVTFQGKAEKICIHVKHPAVSHLLNNTQRRHSDLVFFLSSMMSLLNREEEVITDEHEREFHVRLLRFALEECQGSWAGEI